MFVPHAANYLATPHKSAFFASTARRSGLFKRFRLAASQSHAKSAATGLIAAHHLQGISAASPDSLRCAAGTTYIASFTTIRTKSGLPLRRECDLHSAAANQIEGRGRVIRSRAQCRGFVHHQVARKSISRHLWLQRNPAKHTNLLIIRFSFWGRS